MNQPRRSPQGGWPSASEEGMPSGRSRRRYGRRRLFHKQPSNEVTKCQTSVIFAVSTQLRSGGTRKSGFLLAVSAFQPGNRRARTTTNRARPGVLRSSSDMATRERGYGAIKSRFYDMKLSPVGSPPPPWPGDEEYKPRAWLLGVESGIRRAALRLETKRRDVPANCGHQYMGRSAKSEPQAAAAEQQPVVRFAGRVSVPIKALKKSFYRPGN